MPERYELQRLLWDLRHDDAAAAAARADLAGFLARYDLSATESAALADGDFAALIRLGASPLLVYFGALEMGVERAAYYASFAPAPAAGPRPAGAPGPGGGR